MASVKRAILALFLLLAGLAVAHGFSLTRRERLYRQFIVLGDHAAARGDGFAAVHAFSDAVAQKPESMLGYMKRGEAHHRRGDLDAAETDLEHAARLDPTEPRVLELAGDVESARQAHARAASSYAAAVALDDRSPRVLYKLGLALHLGGSVRLAAEALSKAVALDGRFAEAQYLLGVTLRDLNRNREAEQRLNRAVALAPSLLAARELLADLYLAQGRRAERITQLEQLSAVDPKPSRQVALALAYAQAGGLARALRLLRTVTEVQPDDAGAHLALGTLLLDIADGSNESGSLASAIKALERASSIDPSGAALLQLGKAQLAADEPAAAERILEQAVEKLPIDPGAFLLLANAAERAGHPDVARRALGDCQALLPPGDDRLPIIADRLAGLNARD